VGSGQGTTRISYVDDARRLDEQRVDFPIRDRAVLDTSRYDEQLAGCASRRGRVAEWSACGSRGAFA